MNFRNLQICRALCSVLGHPAWVLDRWRRGTGDVRLYFCTRCEVGQREVTL